MMNCDMSIFATAVQGVAQTQKCQLKKKEKAIRCFSRTRCGNKFAKRKGVVAIDGQAMFDIYCFIARENRNVTVCSPHRYIYIALSTVR